jgi:hypothetical protein
LLENLSGVWKDLFVLGRRFEMRDLTLAFKEQIHSAKSNIEMDLDEVIRSLEEAAQEIEEVDWEHGGRKEKRPAFRADLCDLLEAAIGFEPMNNGFADRCLSHLAMPPKKTKQKVRQDQQD